jgi:hypothetical protein
MQMSEVEPTGPQEPIKTPTEPLLVTKWVGRGVAVAVSFAVTRLPQLAGWASWATAAGTLFVTEVVTDFVARAKVSPAWKRGQEIYAKYSRRPAE